MITNIEVFVRLILSTFIGGVIGFERESSNRPAGFRTHILVSVGSTLIMLVSMYAMPESADQSRIAAQVVSGIGFLGAGTIMITGDRIKGLTTAASLWVSAGMGLAIGSGYYFGGIVTFIIVLVSLVILSRIEKNVLRRKNNLIRITANDRPGLIGEVGGAFGKHNVSIRRIAIEDIADKDSESQATIGAKFYIDKPKGFDYQKLYDELLKISGVRSVDYESKRKKKTL